MSDTKPYNRFFVTEPTAANIKARTEVRFGLPRTNPNVKPVEVLKPDITNPAPGLPITQTHLDIWELKHRGD